MSTLAQTRPVRETLPLGELKSITNDEGALWIKLREPIGELKVGDGLLFKWAPGEVVARGYVQLDDVQHDNGSSVAGIWFIELLNSANFLIRRDADLMTGHIVDLGWLQERTLAYATASLRNEV